jgi:hypothetical protein
MQSSSINNTYDCWEGTNWEQLRSPNKSWERSKSTQTVFFGVYQTINIQAIPLSKTVCKKREKYFRIFEINNRNPTASRLLFWNSTNIKRLTGCRQQYRTNKQLFHKNWARCCGCLGLVARLLKMGRSSSGDSKHRPDDPKSGSFSDGLWSQCAARNAPIIHEYP